MDTNEGNDAAHEREEGGQQFTNEIYPGASQPATEIDDSQRGVFRASTPPPNAGSSDVTTKTWQKKKQTVTTRAALLRARNSREKKINSKFLRKELCFKTMYLSLQTMFTSKLVYLLYAMYDMWKVFCMPVNIASIFYVFH
ncbi:hypothetical protein POM88_027056 [Heracleum sosnowskyi]|uniref:Uncharacterized protein n=1 Tax=Heracleum sosnowskyi TaxID=360622 RepID=A0AAD8MPI2_9APIA|nr:hypothetical protein POM88_027056 [Heracleum sosnowskyi]